jgi:hypothetical protein
VRSAEQLIVQAKPWIARTRHRITIIDRTQSRRYIHGRENLSPSRGAISAGARRSCPRVMTIVNPGERQTAAR